MSIYTPAVSTIDMEELKINEVLHELSECREDERGSQNQVIQVITAAGTIIGVCFTVSAFLSDDKSSIQTMTLVNRILLFLTSCVLCTAFPYITFLGINNVLRYHYIQDLEDRLTKLIYKNARQNAPLHWMSFSSPIMTKNPLHIKTGYTLITYSSYAIATLSAVFFGLSTVIVEYIKITDCEWYDYCLVAVPFVFITFSFIVFIIISIRARDMFDRSLSAAKNKRENRFMASHGNQKNFSSKNILRAILYFIYPKRKDFQKLFLIPLGAIISIFLLNGTVTYELVMAHFKDIVAAVFIIDVLVYQSRYQWNDIRGVVEDQASGKTDRLPVEVLGKKPAVILSLIVISLKCFLAIHISLCNYNTLLPYIFLIALVAVFYELARQYKRNNLVFILVGFGYPLRIFSGLLPLKGIDSNSKIIFLLLFLAYTAFGCFSALLPWTHEAILEKRSKNFFTKSYYYPLYNIIETRDTADFPDEYISLKEDGKITDPWNVSYVVSIIALSMVLSYAMYTPLFVLLEALSIFAAIYVCLSSSNNIVFRALIFILLIVLKGIISVVILKCSPLYICICVHQLLFLMIYFILRFQFNPNFNFFKVAFSIIIGKSTSNYLS